MLLLLRDLGRLRARHLVEVAREGRKVALVTEVALARRPIAAGLPLVGALRIVASPPLAGVRMLVRRRLRVCRFALSLRQVGLSPVRVSSRRGITLRVGWLTRCVTLAMVARIGRVVVARSRMRSIVGRVATCKKESASAVTSAASSTLLPAVACLSNCRSIGTRL